MWHHVIPKHEWKVRFGALKGVNAKDNLVNLTLEQHIQVHQILYEFIGNDLDRLAYLGLAKMISREEIIKSLQSYPKTEAHRDKISKALKGKKNSLGLKRTEEHKAKISIAMLGNKNCVGRKSSDKQKASVSKASLGRKKSPESIAKYIESRRRNKFAVVSQIVDCLFCKQD